MYWLEIADLRGRTCDDKEETIMYLDEYLSKTKEILDTHKLESSVTRFKTHKEYRWSKYLLATGQVNSVTEVPQKIFERNTDEHSFTFTLLCGVPGVGKSTFIKKYLSGSEIISMDEIRAELGDRRDQSKNKKVALIAKERLKEALRKKKNVLWDATSIRKEHREQLLSLAEAYGAYTSLFVLLDKEKNIRAKNKDREFAVPDEVITRMIENFQYPSPDEAVQVLYINMGTIDDE